MMPDLLAPTRALERSTLLFCGAALSQSKTFDPQGSFTMGDEGSCDYVYGRRRAARYAYCRLNDTANVRAGVKPPPLSLAPLRPLLHRLGLKRPLLWGRRSITANPRQRSLWPTSLNSPSSATLTQLLLQRWRGRLKRCAYYVYGN